MARDLPAGLSEAQRIVLSEFYAGRVSAGELTKRLGIEAPEVAHQNVDPDVHRPRALRIPTLLMGFSARARSRGQPRLALERAEDRA